MRKVGWSGVLVGAVVIASVGAARVTVGAATLAPAAAIAPSSLASDSATGDDTLHASSLSAAVTDAVTPLDDWLTVASTVEAPAPSPEPTEAPSVPTPEPARAAAPTAAPVVVAPPVATPAPVVAASCPANYFCYPRLGIAGPIVPYTDCSGSTDVGTSIRSYTCLSDFYLMGHAYTQFGLVRQWVAGDVVFAWGRRFTVYGALTEQSCSAPVFPLAPLSMQTSLSSATCGPVLVVQAR